MKHTIALFLLSCTSIFAQSFSLSDYDWADAEYETVSVDDSTNLQDLLSKRTFFYYYNDDNALITDYLYHRKVYINSHDAIDRLNKVYISQSEDNIKLFKARVINPSGNTIEITKDKVLTGVDEDTEQEYAYFALEGLEVGSQIEYFFVKEINSIINGIQQDIQDYYPIQRFELDIVTPWNLVMGAKLYNIEGEFSEDTTLENMNHIYFHADSIPAMAEESSAFTEAHLSRAIFKLDRNLYTGKGNIVAYSHIAQRVVDNLNRELSKKELKALSKIQKEINKSELTDGISKARQIENYLKTNYYHGNYAGEEFYNMASIYENKVYNELGGLTLYTNLLKMFDIDYKVAYTSDRSELPFDPDFASNLYLQTILIYVDEEDMFMDPTSPLSRMGYIDDVNLHNYALFIDEMDLNGNTVGIANTEFIDSRPSSFTIDSLDVKVTFGENLSQNSLAIKRTLSGYTAGFYQPLLEFIKDEDSKKEFEESILKYVDSESEVISIDILNGSANMLGVKPLIVNGTLESDNIIESAGNNFLFKVGNLIGPQTEMYSDEGERKLNVETSHARTYFRTIAFEVPEGYEISGLESLKMDEILTYDSKTSGRFTSNYTVNNNQVIVTIEEYYNEVEYPKELFEDYRRVINAAADFNKKTLLLKKI